MLDRRTLLFATPAAALLGSSGASAQSIRADKRLIVSDLFQRLRRPLLSWSMVDLFWDLVTFIDVNNVMFGEVTGRDSVLRRLGQMREAGELDIVHPPDADTVVVSDQWVTFSTALSPPPNDGIGSAFERPIIFAFQISTNELENDGRPYISLMSVMRPFERSWCAAQRP